MDVRSQLLAGLVIPAHPLALNAERKLDERRQRALSRYYLAAGAGGLAVGVHTTQFAIREPRHGMLRPILEIAAEEMRGHEVVRIAGICGGTAPAAREAALARELGYDAGLLSLGALRQASVDELIAHCREIADILPIVGFYLQPSVGGRVLSYGFWRRFTEIENVMAIKIAPFNRYQTLDVVRAVVESGRDIALYTGNDDNILIDLLTRFDFGGRSARIAGGLLGHWAVWTSRAAEHLKLAKAGNFSLDILTLAQQITDSNAALFDPANSFRCCVAGIHEVLRRQGLLEGRWCLDPEEDLSPGQMEEIDRVYRTYPHLADDDFVQENLASWLK